MAKIVTKSTMVSAGIVTPSAAVLAARARRDEKAEGKELTVRWFIDEVSEKIELTMTKRVRIATEYVKDRIVRNISVPVVRGFEIFKDTVLDTDNGKTSTRKRRETFVVERSQRGEFPRAETTQLMKTIFSEYRNGPGGPEGYIGTPLDYGLILELRMDRSFLVRTLQEEADVVRSILSGPIPGGKSNDFAIE